MASELRVDTLKDSSGNNSVGMSYVAGGSAKVWISLTMTTATNEDSLNVGSITDNSAGNFSINASTSFANSDYAVMSGSSYNQASNVDFGEITNVESTSSYRHIHRENNAGADTQYGSFTSAFGDLA